MFHYSLQMILHLETLGKSWNFLSVQKSGSPCHFTLVQRLAAKDNVCQFLNIFMRVLQTILYMFMNLPYANLIQLL